MHTHVQECMAGRMHTEPQAYCKQSGEWKGCGAEQWDPNRRAAFQSLSPLQHCFQIRFENAIYIRGERSQPAA